MYRDSGVSRGNKRNRLQLAGRAELARSENRWQEVVGKLCGTTRSGETGEAGERGVGRMRGPCRRQRRMKCWMMSMGSGKMMVAFFSELMLDSVCR